MTRPQQSRVLFSPGWSPLLLPGLVLWLDANQIRDVGDGGAVSTWSDLSGNRRNFSQSNASYKPLLKTNVINNCAAVRFDGSNDYLECASLTLPLAEHTLILVARENSEASNAGILSAKPASGNDWANYDGMVWTTGNHVGNKTLSETSSGSSVEYAGGSSLALAIYAAVKSPGYNCTIYFNGGSATGGTSLSNDNTANSAGSLALGARYLPGIASPYLNGDIAEIIYTSYALSANERRAAESYLSDKYGIALS